MERAPLRLLADRVRHSANPVHRGRELLLEEYSKTKGVEERRAGVSAAFELKRSVVVQAAYEALFGGGEAASDEWLAVARLKPELADAIDACRRGFSDGLSACLRRSYPGSEETADFILRSALETEALRHERFLGSVRRHVPGVGYAISVRKRHCENQDSFELFRHEGRSVFVIGDGCGSARFASLASHMAVREICSRARNGMGRRDICEISGRVRDMLNDEAVRTAAGSVRDSGVSTLLLAISEGSKSRVYKVGDSIPFFSWNDAKADLLEVLARNYDLVDVLGQHPELREECVEEYEREGGRVLLTSDGVTNYLGNPSTEIAQWTRLSYDPVIIGERILRSVLRNQIEWDHSDDVTIIVQDGKVG